MGYRDPILSMAPGHGEGHNSGQAVNIVAALAGSKYLTGPYAAIVGGGKEADETTSSECINQVKS